jgi:hypothetical protein
MPNIGYARKTTPISVISPSLHDIIWAAGFCEGEACFNIANGKSEQVSIPQNGSRDVLERMKSLFGGKISTRKNLSPSGKVQDIWYICGSRARGFMMTIYTFMGTRRKEQIRKALNK